MKGIVFIKEEAYAWLGHHIPEAHPLLIPICNKPYIEFLVDFSVLTGCDALRIVSDGPLNELERYCDHGSRWGIEISFAHMLPDDDDEAVFAKNGKFCSGERIMLVSGLVFISYDKTADYRQFFSSIPAKEVTRCNGGHLTIVGGFADGDPVSPPLLEIGSLESIKDYHRLSMAILEGRNGRYVLPGFGADGNCPVGSNVLVSKKAELIRPFIIGCNVRIGDRAVIGPNAVIGSNVIISKGSRIIGSIVTNRTYVGEELDLLGKIASTHMLTDAGQGISIPLADAHLISGLDRSRTLRLTTTIVHGVAAATLIAALCVPYAMLWAMQNIRGKWTTVRLSYRGKAMSDPITIVWPVLEHDGMLNNMARALSIDRFPMLPKVLTGRLAIIGHSPVATSESSSSSPDMPPMYRPAVFSYAEAAPHPGSDFEAGIIEDYYAVHSDPVKDIIMTATALFTRTQTGKRSRR